MSKPKVYIVTRGEYSDYYIEKVFSTREAAEKYVAIDSGKDDEPQIEEYDLEDGSNIRIDRMYKAVFFQVLKRWDGTEYVVFEMKYGTSPFPSDICVGRKADSGAVYKGISGYISVNKNMTEADKEKVEKMVFDRVAKWKAEQNGLC